jgi:hypothetical protein
MSSLKEYAAKGKKPGAVPWRERSDSNRAAWIEACQGVKNGIPALRAAKWLSEEKGCPLMIDTIRTQLKNTMDRYVKS